MDAYHSHLEGEYLHRIAGTPDATQAAALMDGGLAWAMALDLEPTWRRQLGAEVLSASQLTRRSTTRSHGFFSGAGSGGGSAFSSALGTSLAAAVSTSSSSTSSRGGGGSSGGGGGGGGGGGW